MTTAHIKIGMVLLLAQVILIAMTYGFHGMMDRSAERAGISTIIQEATR